jgi:hypothetical protein
VLGVDGCIAHGIFLAIPIQQGHSISLSEVNLP